MSGGRSPVLTTVAVIVMVSAAIGWDLLEPSEARSQPEPRPAEAAVAGAAYCAAGATVDDHDLRVVVAAPAGPDAPAETDAALVEGGVLTPLGVQRIFPETARELPAADGRHQVGVVARWWEWPVAVSRVWSIAGAGLPSGFVSGPCPSAPSTSWYVPGMTTAGGASARLYLANPFATDASVAIRFTAPTGEIAPLLLENVVVPARDVAMVDLNEHVPRQADLGVVVESRAGRVVVEGVQLFNAAIGGVDAVALAPAVPSLQTTWSLPWSVSDPPSDLAPDVPESPGTPAPDAEEPVPGSGNASWLWISNPGDEAAAITVTLHGREGAVVPDIGDELTVSARSILRIDLRGLLPAGQQTAGVTVRSENDVPVAVSVGSILRAGDDPARAGFAAQVGVAEPDTGWILPGEGTEGREQVLHLTNPGAEPAVVTVALWTGSSVSRPEELAGVEVSPGSLVEVDLTPHLPAATHHAVFVTASEGQVVVGRRSAATEGPLGWVVNTGVPMGPWRGGGVVPQVGYDSRLVERLDTELGLDSTRDGEELLPEPTTQPTAGQ